MPANSTTAMAPPTGMAPPSGLYILNDGPALSGPPYYSASTLSFYNLSTRQLTPDQFSAANGKALGYTGNDLEIYGKKMYIVLTNSSVIDIVDIITGKLIKEVAVLDPTTPPPSYRQPGNIAFYNGNVYISSYDGTITVMDTMSFSVTTKITIPNSSFLGGLVVQNRKLYVANSGIGTGVTDMVSVIDLSSNQEIKRIHVAPYPVSVAADSYGNVYVVSGWTDDWQQFNVSTGGLTIIDSKTDEVKSPTLLGRFQARNEIPITVSGDLLYYAKGSFVTGNNKIALYNTKTQTPASDNFITDGTIVQTPYSICVNQVTGEVYISDGKNADFSNSTGEMYVFDKTGKLEYSFSTGVSPVKIKLVN